MIRPDGKGVRLLARNRYDIDEKLDAPFNLDQFRSLLQFSRPYLQQLVRLFVVMVLSSAIGLLSPLIFMEVLNKVLPNKDIPGLLSAFGGLTAILAIVALLGIYRVRKMNMIGQGIIHDIRLAMYRHLQRLPFTYFDERPHGKILVRVVHYVNSVSDLLSNGLVNALVDLLSLVFIILYMLLVDPLLTLYSLAGLPILVTGLLAFKNAQRKAQQALARKNSNLNAYTQESLIGMQVTQVFAREKFNRGIFHRLHKEYRQAWMKSAMLNLAMWPFIDVVSNATIALLYAGGVLWLRNAVTGAPILPGTIMTFVGYVQRFWAPILSLANFYNGMVNSAAYVERIFEFLHEPVVIADKEHAYELPKIEGRIAFDNVSFCYDPGHPVLDNVSFDVEPGTSLALVGPTGAGKTTIINLLCRFYDISEGSITIDGHPIQNVTQASLRTQMGVMLQDPFLFPETVMENIRYGKLDASDDECIAAARAVCAHEFIMRLPKGYNTKVNELGSGVSAGERQLISFARVMLADPRILILDEATSSIDTKTEKALQQGLESLMRGRTSIIIAHRLSTVKNASRIMVIADHGIAESGTHDELLSLQGQYWSLYNSQFAALLG
jgi:ATP-binding cassette, subfamily B, multidrug efflux pump